MSLATLNGHAVTWAVVQVPAWGIPWADIALEDDEVLSGVVTLALADVSLSMTVISGGVHAGVASYRLVGGAGGWGREVAAKGYADDMGVKVATVLRDAASLVGETVADAPATRVGPHYARASTGAVSRVLHDLAPRNWYVDFAGVTRVGQRATTTYAGDGARTNVDPAGAIIEIATESIATLVPGVVVDGSLPATDVEYQLDAKRLTTRIYAGLRSSRRLDALRRIYDALDPRRPYRGLFEFRVVTQSGERLNLQPVRVASGLSDLARVPVRPGMAGMRATVALGSLVLVAFADADPSRPCVVAHDAPDSPGFMPIELDFGEAPRLGVARVTDPVIAGPFGGTITVASARIKAGL